jgi:FkbM family methyltransferase
MKWIERLHTFHRLLRYRWRTERAELRYLLGRKIRGGSVLDIGAHRGVYSYWMHRSFRDGTRIVAFEPQPELAQFLTEFKQVFRLERMQVEAVGVTSRTGTLRLRRPPMHWGAATFDEFSFADREAETLDVPVTTIDDYRSQHPELRPIRFIKCDVEYHEADVLAGAERTLREDRPELLVEWATPRRAYRERLFAQMQRLNYAVYQFEYGRLVPCTTAARHSPPSWELGPNYLFVPRENATSVAA